jgi:peroxiredoxin
MKTSLVIFSLIPSLAMSETLEEKLDARSTEAAGKVDPAVRAEFAKGIEAVAESGIINKAIKVGDTAPDFTLKNADAEKITLSTLLKDGPVVLTWYRGGWCPYCNIALQALQEELPAIKKAGATLVALSPELPEKASDTTAKNSLDFEVLSDISHGVARKYGIVFELTPEVRTLYKQFFNLTDFNGADAGDATLPLAATYVIDTDGTVKWAFLDADYRKRAEPSEVTAAVKALRK